MPYFNMVELIHYYDGPQVMLMEYDSSIKKNVPLLLVAQTVDDDIFFGSRITKITLNNLRNKHIDIHTAMSQPYQDECYVIVDHRFLPLKQQSRRFFNQIFGFKVDGIHQSYIDWAVPDPGLYFDI